MSKSNRDLKDILKKVESVRTSAKQVAFLGHMYEDGLVKAGKGKVYVTLNTGQVVKIRNNRVPNRWGWFVEIGYEGKNTVKQVLRMIDIWDSAETPEVPEHWSTHEWGGPDSAWIRLEQIKPGVAMPDPDNPLMVQFYGMPYFVNGKYRIIDSQLVDMESEIPVSGAEWVNVEVDENRELSFNHGDNSGSAELLSPEDIPATDPLKKLLFSVKMYVGQTRIYKNLQRNDIFDPRLSGFATGGVANSVEWEEILEKPDWVDAIQSGQLFEYIEIERWSALEGDDTFDYPDFVLDIISVEVNGITQDPFTYSLSEDGDQVILDDPLDFDAIVTSKYKVEVL